jgi:site-specific recombinase XerD
MSVIKLRFVHKFTDRHGTIRYYFRKAGKRTPLPGKPGGKEFMDAYGKLLDGAPAPKKAEVGKGSFDGLCARYYRSEEYLGLEEITQKNYRRVIERLRSKVKAGVRFGSLPIASMKPAHMKALLTELVDRPGASYSLRRVLRLLFTLAVADELIPVSPMEGIKAHKKARNGPGIRPLTQDDIKKFRDFYPLGTKPRLAFELLYNTAGRRTDAVALGRQHMVGGEFSFTASKNGVEVDGITILPMTKAAIDAWPQKNLTLLVTEYGAPFTPQGFTNWFKDKCKTAGLPDASSPHGVRKAVLTELAENGATTKQLQAVAGHLTLSESEKYVKTAERKRLARAALSTIVEQEVATPEDRFANSGEKS